MRFLRCRFGNARAAAAAASIACLAGAAVLIAPPHAARAGGGQPPPGISLSAGPCFTGFQSRELIEPVAIKVVNDRGVAISSDIEVGDHALPGDPQAYHLSVTVPANATRVFYAYPNRDLVLTSGGTLAVRAWGATVEFSLPQPTAYGTSSAPPLTTDERPGLCLVSGGVGALEPPRKPAGVPVRLKDRLTGAHPEYVRPENAPDRALGYAGIRTLVVACDERKLSPAQWKGIRDWVASGGSLIFFARPGEENATQPAPGAAELLPVSDVGMNLRADAVGGNYWRDPSDTIQRAFAVDDDRETAVLRSDLYPVTRTDWQEFKIAVAQLKPDCERLDRDLTPYAGTETLLARRRLGLGTILYCGFDPTTYAFRRAADLDNVWRDLAAAAAPSVSADLLSATAAERLAVDDGSTAGAKVAPGQERTDPFHVSVPPLRLIVYIFLADFVLAVPVTFAVLRRKRRMNLAWVTLPVLSVGTAVVLYGLASPLHQATFGRRTVGTIVAASGDTTALFQGGTDAFFPQSGTFDVALPSAADRLALDDSYYTAGTPDAASFHCVDDATAVRTASLRVPNLAFRRILQVQHVDLGKGITVDIKRNCPPSGDPSSGCRPTVTGIVHNGTGRTLHNVVVYDPYEEASAQSYEPAYPEQVIAVIGDALPGDTPFRAEFGVTPSAEQVMQLAGGDWMLSLIRHPSPTRHPASVLLATLPGDDFGPRIGRSFGDNRDVHLVVSLPPFQETTGKEAANGR